jgi:hypothetical protein
MRSRLSLDGATTAYRDERTDDTLEESEMRTKREEGSMHPHPDQHELMTTIEIEVQGRWDALALSELLIPFHSFLVQHDREHWVIHAEAPGCHGESVSEALTAIDDWRSERDSQSAWCRVGGHPYHLHERRVA